MVESMEVLGIDIGGSGVKGAIIDSSTGKFLSDRLRIPTPSPANRKNLLDVLNQIVNHFDWTRGCIGVGFPGVIRQGVIFTAANLDSSLIGLNLESELGKFTSGPVRVLNDADAAGVAEVRIGEGEIVKSGTVLMITVGTGIGVALFTNRILVPNLELGHIEFKGSTAELLLSERTRKSEGVSWKVWGNRFNEFLQQINFLINPDLILLGGGGVKNPDEFLEFIDKRLPIKFARFRNNAGIIGAAIFAAEPNA